MSSKRPDGPVYTVENRVGRLVEARVVHIRTPDEVDAYFALSARLIAKLGGPVVLCADHRPVRIYTSEVADRFLESLRHVNALLERVAIVVSPTNATLTMQLERLVRAAEFDARRVTTAPEAAAAYLSECLEVAEVARLRAFLREGAAVGQRP
jgi:hypothetical protein